MIGFVVLSRAFEDEIEPDDVSIVAGILMLALGFLLICRTAVRLLPPIAGRLPVAARLALRDLGRHQARSGAALAAIGLGLGIPVAIIGIGSAVEYQKDRADGPGNLADDQLLVHVGDPPALVPSRTSTELDQMEAAVEQLAETLDDATVVPLDAAVDPSFTGTPGSTAARTAFRQTCSPSRSATTSTRATWCTSPPPRCSRGRASTPRRWTRRST